MSIPPAYELTDEISSMTEEDIRNCQFLITEESIRDLQVVVTTNTTIMLNCCILSINQNQSSLFLESSLFKLASLNRSHVDCSPHTSSLQIWVADCVVHPKESVLGSKSIYISHEGSPLSEK